MSNQKRHPGKADTEQHARPRWHERTAQKDILFRGPLNYAHFQIIGWLCIVASQGALILQLGSRFVSLPESYQQLREPLIILSLLSLPFLLIANFAQIMNGKKTYKSLLLKNFGAAAGIWGVYAFILHRYVVGNLDFFNDGTVSSLQVISQVAEKLSQSGVVCFNIFIDLFLCTLVMFFLNYTPKKNFTGKSILVFRSFTLLPIAYEVGCMVLKFMSFRKEIWISPYLFPLVTVKPPMTFLLFLILAVYIKTREIRFRRHGKTREEYNAFLHTNKNSWDFSLFLAITLVVISLMDNFIMYQFSVRQVADFEVTGIYTPLYEILGFGDASSLIFLAPLVLLFSYTREPKLSQAGMLIPVGAASLIVLLYLEAGHQAVPMLDPPKFNFEILVNPALQEELMGTDALLEPESPDDPSIQEKLQETDALPEPDIPDDPPAAETDSPQP